MTSMTPSTMQCWQLPTDMDIEVTVMVADDNFVESSATVEIYEDQRGSVRVLRSAIPDLIRALQAADTAAGSSDRYDTSAVSS